jgi:hypothetical protein
MIEKVIGGGNVVKKVPNRIGMKEIFFHLLKRLNTGSVLNITNRYKILQALLNCRVRSPHAPQDRRDRESRPSD